MGTEHTSAPRVSALICKLMMNHLGTWFSGGLSSAELIVVLNDSVVRSCEPTYLSTKGFPYCGLQHPHEEVEGQVLIPSLL